MNVPQLMWAVGLYEGEGSTFISEKKSVIKLGMTDKDVIERFHETVGFGWIAVEPRENCKTMYVWRSKKKDNNRKLLAEMLPHLGDRRAHKALDVLDYLECK